MQDGVGTPLELLALVVEVVVLADVVVVDVVLEDVVVLDNVVVLDDVFPFEDVLVVGDALPLDGLPEIWPPAPPWPAASLVEPASHPRAPIPVEATAPSNTRTLLLAIMILLRGGDRRHVT
jgi:hypothetical protein